MKIKIKDKIYDVEILETKEEMVKIIVNGKEFIFGEEKEKEIPAVKLSFPKRDFSKKEIKAPITGTISEIFVKEGDFVKSGQKVLLLSSMKMENEIISEFEGRVKEISVKKGENVKEGKTLIIII